MVAMSAAEWRTFWEARGMRELRLLLWAAWDPLGELPPGDCDAFAFRVASLLGSRAPRDAIAAELGRIRRDELAIEPEPDEDARAAARVAAWFEAASA
jgi:hypothetical protein